MIEITQKIINMLGLSRYQEVIDIFEDHLWSMRENWMRDSLYLSSSPSSCAAKIFHIETTVRNLISIAPYCGRVISAEHPDYKSYMTWQPLFDALITNIHQETKIEVDKILEILKEYVEEK